MSYATTPTFIHSGSWSETTRSHPAMKWFEGYVRNIIDERKWDTPAGEWHTTDFTYIKSDGTKFVGGETAWSGIQKTYAPFTANLHEPNFLVCWETEYGYDMIGRATVFANLVGEPSATEGEKKVDPTGKAWDVGVPSAFQFKFVKEGDSFKLGQTEIFSDGIPVFSVMSQRGLIKPS